MFAKDSALSDQLPRIEKEAGKITELLAMTYPLLKQYVDQSDHAEGRYRFAHGDVGPSHSRSGLADHPEHQRLVRTPGGVGRYPQRSP